MITCGHRSGIPLKRLIHAIAILFLGLLCSCAVPIDPSALQREPGENLSLYLQPLPQEAARLTIEIQSLNAHREKGEEIPLLTSPVTLETSRQPGHQSLLLSKSLPTGSYRGVTIRFKTAALQTEEGTVALHVDSDPQHIEGAFQIRPNQAATLFLSLQPERMVTAGYRLTPRFTLERPQLVLPTLKGMITHPDDNAMSFFEKKTPRMVATLAVGQHPVGVALDSAGRRVYVALRGAGDLAVVDLVREQILRKLRLQAGDTPTNLALAFDDQALLVTSPATNSLSIIDTTSFTERQRLQFPAAPSDVFISADGRTGYVTLPEIAALAIIDIARRTLVGTQFLEEAVVSGLASQNGEWLFLLTESTQDLLVVEPATLQVENRIFVGGRTHAMTEEKNSQLLYVGLQNGEIAVIDPLIGLPIEVFRAQQEIVDMIIEHEENSLFVLSQNGRFLEKYDLVSKHRLGLVDLGRVSSELVVMGGR